MWGQKTLATREKKTKTCGVRKPWQLDKKHVGSENPGNKRKNMWCQKTLTTGEKTCGVRKPWQQEKKHVGSENHGNQKKSNLCGQKSPASTVAKVNTGRFKNAKVTQGGCSSYRIILPSTFLQQKYISRPFFKEKLRCQM